MIRPSFWRLGSALPFLLLACDSNSPSTPPKLMAEATFTVVTTDTLRVPFAVGPAAPCTDFNLGGWIALYSSGRYELVLDRVRTVCADNSGGGGAQWAQQGEYMIAGDSITFSPDAGAGPEFRALLNAAAPQRGVITQGTLNLTTANRRYYLATEPGF